MYDVPLVGNPKSLDPQFADDPSSNTVIRNLYSGLMETDADGNIVCCNASDYKVSDDGKVYTFYLREDNYWFFDKNNDDIISEEEYFPVTSHDYEFALRRVLDPAMKSPYSEDFSCIMGADEVLKGTQPLSFAEIYSPNDYTLQIVLDAPNEEFLHLMATAAAYPCCEWFFDSTKGRYGLDDRSVMSNGAFYVRQWFYDPYGHNNILYMRRNDANWSDSYDIMPSFLSFTIERDEESVREIFKDGEIECFTTLDSSMYNPDRYNVEDYPAVTLGLIFNPGDKIFSNLNMRRALALSVGRSETESLLDGDMYTAYGIIPPAVKLYGRSYRELVSDRGFYYHNEDEAMNCYEKAKEELKFENIENIKILVNAETSDSKSLHVITRQWQELFGCLIGVEDVTADEFDSRIESGDYLIALYPLKGNLAIGRSVIRELENKSFFAPAVPEDGMTAPLASSSSPDELIEAYTEIEKYIIGTYRFVPLFYKNSYLISDKDNEFIEYDPFSGAVDYRLAQNYD
ncbi:MAG: peptide ABC transporter substrate-binding protein [Ruminococcus sp.]|nr:peptide ABC transporter substrate-binding protein [Ruminococcus sp.]